MNKQVYKQERKKYVCRGAIGAFLATGIAGALLCGLTSRPFWRGLYDLRQADLKATAAQVEAYKQKQEERVLSTEPSSTRPTGKESYLVSKVEKEKEKER